MSLIDWKEENDNKSWASWALVEAVCAVGMENFKDFDRSKLDVKMQVNGIGVDFKAIADNLDSQLKEMKAKHKKEGVEEARENITFNLISCLENLEV